MLIRPAEEKDYAEIVRLANWAYRGEEGSAPSWNIENGYLAGQRLDQALLREELGAKPGSALLTFHESEDSDLLGTVWVTPLGNDVWYVGLLTVRPDRQGCGLGRQFLDAGEDWARQHDGKRMRMTVLHIRDVLMGWYRRRGYELTGETQPFPYGDERFGIPMVDDLYFDVMEKAL